MDGVLITEPVGPLDRVVHVPSPVVLGHVSQGGIDASLRGDGVRSGGEELCDAGRVEAGLCETECGAQTGASRSDDNGIVLVVDDGVLARHDGLPTTQQKGSDRGSEDAAKSSR